MFFNLVQALLKSRLAYKRTLTTSTSLVFSLFLQNKFRYFFGIEPCCSCCVWLWHPLSRVLTHSAVACLEIAPCVQRGAISSNSWQGCFSYFCFNCVQFQICSSFVQVQKRLRTSLLMGCARRWHRQPCTDRG